MAPKTIANVMTPAVNPPMNMPVNKMKMRRYWHQVDTGLYRMEIIHFMNSTAKFHKRSCSITQVTLTSVMCSDMLKIT